MSHPFKVLGIPEDMTRVLEEPGIVTPTPVQRQVIAFLVENGGDLIAQTGTEKTADFGLPLLMKMNTKHRDIQGHVLARWLPAARR